MNPQLEFNGNKLELIAHFYKIGRGNNADIKIPSPSVSRGHCVLMRNNNHYLIADWYPGTPKSKNGVEVDGKKVEVYKLEKRHEIKIAPDAILIYYPGSNYVQDIEATIT